MIDQQRTRLRFAVACDSLEWRAWEVWCIQHVLDREMADLVLLILPPANLRPAQTATSIFYHLFQKVLRPRSLDIIDVSKRYRDVPRIECPSIPECGGGDHAAYDFKARIDEQNLDFVVSVADTERIPADILGGIRYGGWFFRVDEFSPARGGLPSFWGIHTNRLTSGVFLEKRTSQRNRRTILRAGNYRAIHYSFTKNVDYIYARASAWVSEICRDIVRQKADYLDEEPEPREAYPAPIPGNLQVLGFGLRLIKNRIKKWAQDALMLEQWNIGVIRRPIEEVIKNDSPLSIQWLLAPSRKEAFADPFPIRSQKSLVFFENFNHRQDKGKISVTTLDFSEERREISVSLEKLHHLSYPFVFEHEGEVYMIPEEWSTNRITLYRAVRFPSDWRAVSVLVDDIAAVDATLFRHDGFWWLFCSPKEDEFTATLLIFYARDLFGPWHPHDQNPVKCDVRNSRSAGSLFRYKDMIIRPAQDCSESYGGWIALNRVLELSPRQFREATLKVLKPDATNPFDKGIHTINPIGNVVVVDGKRHLFSLAHFRQQFRKIAPRVLSEDGRAESFQIIGIPKKKRERMLRRGHRESDQDPAGRSGHRGRLPAWGHRQPRHLRFGPSRGFRGFGSRGL